MALPDSVDLRFRFAEWGLEPRAQGKRGTCSVFAVVGLIEFTIAQAQGRLSDRLSVEYLNWASHQTNERRVDGSFFSDALEGLRRSGICTETHLPYAAEFDADLTPPETAKVDALARRTFSDVWIKEWNPETGLTEEQMLAIKESIAAGQPVAVGLRWPKKTVYHPGHLLETPPPEEVFDGHSIIFVGYTDDSNVPGGGTFLFRNSSGPDWEEGGYARFTYDYARAYANDAVGLRITES